MTEVPFVLMQHLHSKINCYPVIMISMPEALQLPRPRHAA
jgi:hypothetical protein